MKKNSETSFFQNKIKKIVSKKSLCFVSLWYCSYTIGYKRKLSAVLT